MQSCENNENVESEIKQEQVDRVFLWDEELVVAYENQTGHQTSNKETDHQNDLLIQSYHIGSGIVYTSHNQERQANAKHKIEERSSNCC